MMMPKDIAPPASSVPSQGADLSAQARIAESETALPRGTRLLQGQYQIEHPLSDGGFGLTYIARDSLDREVVIKECFPDGICLRESGGGCVPAPGQEKTFRNLMRGFLREAQLLARPNHPNVVAVHQVFRENGTAYIAMDHMPGSDLQSALEEAPEQFTSETLIEIMRQALSALCCIHGLDVLHRDIAPDNLLWGPSGKLTLIDFGTATLRAPTDRSGPEAPPSCAAPIAVKDGYSAPELYPSFRATRQSRNSLMQETGQGVGCDLYSLGATLETLITGHPPVSAETRFAAFIEGREDPRAPLSEGNWPQDLAVLAMIDTAMAVLPQDRFACAETWLGQLPPSGTNMSSTDEESTPALERACDLTSRIASLVAQTNKSLVPHLPRALRPAPPPVFDPPKPQVLVDIFGAPIGDLETWFRDQDRQAKRAKPAPVQTEMVQPPSFQDRLARLKDMPRR